MARCFQDTCSIFVTEVDIPDVGPGYEVNVRYDADSSIYCDQPTGGLDVKIGSGLSKLGDGTIVANPGAETTSFDDSDPWVDVPTTAVVGAPAVYPEMSLPNPLGADAICIVEGNLSFFYAVTGGLTHADIGGLTPYNAQMLARIYARLDAAAYGAAAIAEYVDISGIVPTAGLEDDRQEKGSEPRFSFPYPVPAGSTLHIEGRANWQGPNQRINAGFDGTSDEGQKRGFKLKDVTATWIAS